MDHRWIVRDFMSPKLVIVRLETPLREIQRAFEDQKITAAAVLDEDDSLRGIVSSKDLLHAARLQESFPEEDDPLALSRRTASDLMCCAVLTIDDKTPLARAAGDMVRHRVHRLVVVRGGRPCGVISTSDVMRAIVVSGIKIPLGQIMTSNVETIDMGLPIDEATRRLDDANVRSLVVVDGDWPVGAFSHVEAIQARLLPPHLRTAPVEHVMSYETICLDTSTPIDWVANYAVQTRTRCILAVHGRRLKGIVTSFDLLRVMAHHGCLGERETLLQARASA